MGISSPLWGILTTILQFLFTFPAQDTISHHFSTRFYNIVPQFATLRKENKNYPASAGKKLLNPQKSRTCAWIFAPLSGKCTQCVHADRCKLKRGLPRLKCRNTFRHKIKTALLRGRFLRSVEFVNGNYIKMRVGISYLISVFQRPWRLQYS